MTIDLPAGYTLIDFDDSDQGTFLPGDMLWKLDDLAASGPGADALLRLQLQVTQQTPLCDRGADLRPGVRSEPERQRRHADS